LRAHTSASSIVSIDEPVNYFSREKWDCKGYSGQTKVFVKGVNGGLVEFGYSGQRSEGFKTDIKISGV